MSVSQSPASSFALAVQAYCAWATSPVEEKKPVQELSIAMQLVSNLVSTCAALNWNEGEPSDVKTDKKEIDVVRNKAASLPMQYYSEVFNNLIVPPEEPVVGDLTDDLMDIYTDLSPGLLLYNNNRKDEAIAHWQYWFQLHWGEHATSAIRAMWSYLSNREGSSVEDAI